MGCTTHPSFFVRLRTDAGEEHGTNVARGSQEPGGSAPGTRPQTEKEGGARLAPAPGAGPGGARTRNATRPVPGRRSRLASGPPAALRLRPSPTRHPVRAYPGGSRGPLVLFAPPGRRRGADGQVAESGGGQSPLPSVGGGDWAQGFPAGRSCSPRGSS